MALRTLHIEITHDDQATPAMGTVRFESGTALCDGAGNLVHGPVDRRVRLVAGEATVQLPPCDDPAYSPSGWTYTVTVDTDAWRQRFTLSLPAGDGTAEFSDLIGGAIEEAPADVETYSLLGHTHDNVSDHGGLTGLTDDDHPQYYNAARLAVPLAGKADLVDGKVAQAQLPAVALQDYLGAVASQAAMLALTGQRGDWCYRSDLGTDWQLVADTPAQLAGWQEHHYPASPVQTVQGRTGAVVISKVDLGLGNVDNTSDALKPVSAATQTALDAKGTRLVVARAKVTSGNANLPNTSGAWQPLTGFELAVPAAIGDYLVVEVEGMRNSSESGFLDLAVLVGATLVHYLSTDSAAPAVEGDPAWYPGTSTVHYPAKSGGRDLVVTADHLDGDQVRVVVACKGIGGGVLYASADYPFSWRVTNHGPVTIVSS